MILPDDAPKAVPNAQSQNRLEERPVRDPPPAYPGYSSYQRGELDLCPGSSTEILARSQSVSVVKSALRWRLLARLLVAGIFIWSLCLVVWSRSIGETWRVSPDENNSPDLPHERGGEHVDCERRQDRWSGPDNALSWKFELPLSAEGWSIFSSAGIRGGSFTIVHSSRRLPKDAAIIEITVDNVQTETVRVCKQERATGTIDISIATDQHLSYLLLNQQGITIRVILPADSPVHVPALETRLPGFSHSIETGPLVTFNSVFLGTSRSGISVNYLSADNIKLQTSNGPITGTFDVAHSIELVTSNEKINSNITAHHGAGPNPSTSVLLLTSNGAIYSSMDLVANADSPAAAVFDIDTRTSNDRLELDIPQIALDSVLKLSAWTSNAPARLAVASAYEGSFLLRTTSTSPSLRGEDKPMDPSGRERRRRLMFMQNRGVLYGTVSWDEVQTTAESGNIEVRSSNADVFMELL
ncbi:hypothetical protein CERSUDRAFT_118314 [Gelatoporia subvermispora B]|uniref:Uncharacterized protein n=1 Tax=Ceriporiopsis subvermispora (strain B) TaxID=914234 RepID=M2Q8T2_CERS8|nr:hypothetical protein CERSUDRAFT_118314 [Gelatoporia subvermispora B]